MKPHVAKIKNSLWAEVGLVILAFLSVSLLVFEFSAELIAEQVELIYTIDLIIAMIFLTDFIIGLYVCMDKKTYWKKEWYMLLAAIPISGGIATSLRSIRLLRLLRIARVLARIKKTSSLAEKVMINGSQYIYAASIATIVVFSGAVAIFTVEVDVNPEISTFFDAIWWAVVTSTTVGYGDIFPVTWEGRLVGMVLMIVGIGLVGSVAGFVGGYMLKNRDREAS